jgi:uncharacterized protein YkwD
MSNAYRFVKFGFACLFSLTLLLASLLMPASPAQAESTSPQSPPSPVAAISSTFIDASHLAAGGVSAASSGCGGEIVDAVNLVFEEKVIELVNQERVQRGLPPLKWSEALSNAARYHAKDMADDDYFSHNTYDRANGALVEGCIWYERVRSYYGDFMSLGENIARGFPTPESVVDAWMASEGHRKNILNANYREIGVGWFDDHWVQDFGERAGVYPVIINQEAPETASPDVTIYAYGEWSQIRLRSDNGPWSDWRSFESTLTWSLPTTPGMHTVEAQMCKDAASVTSSDAIEYVGEPSDQQPQPAPQAQAMVFLPLVTK